MENKIEAAKGLAASVLVLLVASGVIDNKLSTAVTAVVASLITLYAAFAVRPRPVSRRKTKEPTA